MHDAFVDAIFQLETLLAVLIGGIYLVLATVGQGLLHISTNGKDKVGVFAGVIVLLVAILTIHNRIKIYEFIPDVEKAYGTPRDRLWVYLYNIGGFVYLVVMIVVAHLIRLHFAVVH